MSTDAAAVDGREPRRQASRHRGLFPRANTDEANKTATHPDQPIR
jgi:hypothetical protein